MLEFRPIRGMTAVVAGAGPAHAFYFASYEYTKEMLTKMSPQHNQLNYSMYLQTTIVYYRLLLLSHLYGFFCCLQLFQRLALH